MPRAILTVLTASAALAAAVSVRAASEDRYGPPHPLDAAAPAAASPAGWLSWSMKTPAPARPATAPAWAARRYERDEPPARPTPDRVAALPTSLYSPYPARPAAEAAPAPGHWSPVPAPQAMNQPPHFYSVHRAFGLSPDPIPLPRQFFADAGPDLAAPPPPLPPHPVPGTQSATSPANTPSNRARQVEIETADSAAN